MTQKSKRDSVHGKYMCARMVARRWSDDSDSVGPRRRGGRETTGSGGGWRAAADDETNTELITECHHAYHIYVIHRSESYFYINIEF